MHNAFLSIRPGTKLTSNIHVNYIFLSEFFFFFQAEDGIRDWSVTGVQTCALPISRFAETLSVRAPVWAKRAEVDVQLTPDLWDELTDFSVTVYDSGGQQIPGGNEAVNYAFGRLSFNLPEKLAGRPLTVEFYPAFAKLPGHPWRRTARIRVLCSGKALADGKHG